MAYGGYDYWGPYVSMAERKAMATEYARKLAKKGHVCCPVTIRGLKIATSFWGKAWCAHMEGFHDMHNRLERGRRYARNGSVFDLQVKPGRVDALVSGSEIYEVSLEFKTLKASQWNKIRESCAGQVASVVELLRGNFSDAIMQILTDRERGMFPLMSDFEMDCSCPDGAGMCKHIAAVIYGIGARLDHDPALLFKLRDVDHTELIASAAKGIASAAASAGQSGIAETELSDVFGVEIATEPPQAEVPPVVTPKRAKAKAKTGKPARSKPKAKRKTKKRAAPKKTQR